jgi:DNA-binding PadR family transcriptional regulator
VLAVVTENNQEGLDVSDRYIRRMLAELEAKGLVEPTTPSKRRQTYVVTEDGRETLAGCEQALIER